MCFDVFPQLFIGIHFGIIEIRKLTWCCNIVFYKEVHCFHECVNIASYQCLPIMRGLPCLNIFGNVNYEVYLIRIWFVYIPPAASL